MALPFLKLNLLPYPHLSFSFFLPQPTGAPTIQITPVVSLVTNNRGKVEFDSLARLFVSSDCTTPEFLEAVTNSLRITLRLRLSVDEQIVSLLVDDSEAVSCVFSYEVTIRKSFPCDSVDCNLDEVAQAAAIECQFLSLFSSFQMLTL